MRFSKLYCPTLKEVPREAEVMSHKLMLRSGLIRKVSSGIYAYLPLGLKIIRKLETIIREELTKIGALEVNLPMVCPSDLWEATGRWDKYGKELCRLTDRHDNQFCLGPTHEEVITNLVGQELRSYKQLPLSLYQIQTKFRDEIRPRFGLMRGREFVMKDAYSFHASEEDLDQTYTDFSNAYEAIFKRCGLSYRIVEADNGSIGGSSSAEFMVTAETGEDVIFTCDSCDYAANLEAAEVVAEEKETTPSTQALTLIDTPGTKTIAEVASFLKKPESETLKTMIYQTEEAVIMVLVRGDHDVNEHKLQSALGVESLEKASEAALAEIGAISGFAGPVGLKKEVQIVADKAINSQSDWVIGANQTDKHFEHAAPGRDFNIERTIDCRSAQAGEACPRCGTGKLTHQRGIEVGHIFKLGETYANALNATYLDENGKQKVATMGCYGVGVGRTIASAIEQSHDEKGIVWPKALAPFETVVIITNMKDETLVNEGTKLYTELLKNGKDVLLDDRKLSAGIKFKDAELLGIPTQVVVGKNFTQEQKIEVSDRKTGEKEPFTTDAYLQKELS